MLIIMTKRRKSRTLHHYNFLSKLHASSPIDRERLLKNIQPEQVRAIISLIYNCLKGGVPINKENVGKLYPYRRKMRYIINNCCSPTKNKKDKIHIKPAQIHKAKKLITNQRGGILPFLLPALAAALPAIGSIIGAVV